MIGPNGEEPNCLACVAGGTIWVRHSIDPEKLYRVTLKHMEVHKLMSQWFWDIWETSSVLGTQI